jgi:hypothetical protein
MCGVSVRLSLLVLAQVVMMRRLMMMVCGGMVVCGGLVDDARSPEAFLHPSVAKAE